MSDFYQMIIDPKPQFASQNETTSIKKSAKPITQEIIDKAVSLVRQGQKIRDEQERRNASLHLQ